MLTDSQIKALKIAKAHSSNVVYAGYNPGSGFRTKVSASTLRALERMGLVTIRVAPDFGMVATLTVAGSAMV